MPFAPTKLILAVDDDVRVLHLVREAVEALLPECAVDTTSNPEYAFELIMRKPYDLLLLDFAMENVDGSSLYTMASKVFTIHQPGGRKMPPMLLMSGYASQRRAQEMLRLPGVRGLIAKPFSLERLVEQVSQAMR
jgi:CheY-like chemotaxis protein